MSKINRSGWLVGLILLFGSVLTACGDGSTPTRLSGNIPSATSGSTPGSTSEPTSTASPANTPTSLPDLALPLSRKWDFAASDDHHFLQNVQLSPDLKISYWIEGGGDQTELIALNNSNGFQKWRFDLTAYNLQAGNPLRFFSQADSDTLYLNFADSKDGSVLALDAATGKPRWEFKLDPGKTYLAQPLYLQGDLLLTAFDSPDTLDIQSDGPLRTTYALALDRKSGTKKWVFQANNQALLDKKIPGPPITYLSVAPQAIYLYAEDHLIYALDPVNGQIRWKLEGINQKLNIITYRLLSGYKDGALIMVTDVVKNTASVRATNAKDGTTRWEVPFAPEKDQVVAGCQASVDEAQFYLFCSASIAQGSTVYTYDLAKGTLLWKQPVSRLYVAPGSLQSPYNLLAGQRLVVDSIITQPGVAVINLQNGQELWSTDKRIQAIAARNNTLYTFLWPTLSALDLQTGQSKWSTDITDTTKAGVRLSIADNLLLLNLGNRIQGYGT